MYLSISIECDLYLRNVFYSSQSITEVCEKDPVLGGASAGCRVYSKPEISVLGEGITVHA